MTPLDIFQAIRATARQHQLSQQQRLALIEGYAGLGVCAGEGGDTAPHLREIGRLRAAASANVPTFVVAVWREDVAEAEADVAACVHGVRS